MKRVLYTAGLCVSLLVLQACSTTDVTGNRQYSLGLRKGEILVSVTPVYFMDYPGGCSLKPIDGRHLIEPFTYQQYLKGHARGFDAEHVAGIIPAGTRIELRGVLASSSYMTDTSVSYKGKVLDGQFKGRTVFIDALMDSDWNPGSAPFFRETYLRRQRP